MVERERWDIDETKSTLSFTLRHIVISEIQGRFGRWGGELLLERDHIDRSTVDVWIDVGSIDTGDKERDAHLISSEFFDIARFPRAQFRSTAVSLRSDGGADVAGLVMLHGFANQANGAHLVRSAWESPGI